MKRLLQMAIMALVLGTNQQITIRSANAEEQKVGKKNEEAVKVAVGLLADLPKEVQAKVIADWKAALEKRTAERKGGGTAIMFSKSWLVASATCDGTGVNEGPFRRYEPVSVCVVLEAPAKAKSAAIKVVWTRRSDKKIVMAAEDTVPIRDQNKMHRQAGNGVVYYSTNANTDSAETDDVEVFLDNVSVAKHVVVVQ
ncbi:hypothetical protein HYV73_04670 [Candidatus Uhrbacteria bacterium]|nr:hypothetical protein [Candidatus Uhrbacteria bacterium]